MTKRDWIRGSIIALAVCCHLYGFFVTLVGDCTPATNEGAGTIAEGVNMNDAVQVIEADDGDVFVLGKTCVQRFDSKGNFIGGAYFSANSLKQTSGSEYLSLNNSCVLVFEYYAKTITVFNKDFNTVETIEVDENYDKNDFYEEYPNTDASGDEAKLSLSNIVKIRDTKIRLDAPRNFVLSRNGGLLILIGAILTLLYMFKDNFNR